MTFEGICFGGPHDGEVFIGYHHTLRVPGGGYYRWQRFGFKRAAWHPKEWGWNGGCYVWWPDDATGLHLNKIIVGVLRFLGNWTWR